MYSELEIDAVKYQPEHFVVSYRNDDFFNSIFERGNQDILVAEVNGKEFEKDTEFQFACGMCNIYAHDYDIIDNDIIWETITEEILELREKLQAIFQTL